MRQYAQYASICLAVLLGFGNVTAADAAPGSDWRQWQQHDGRQGEARQRNARAERENRQNRNAVERQRQQMEMQRRQTIQQSQQREKFRQQQASQEAQRRQQLYMRERQRQQQAMQEHLNRQQTDRRAIDRRQQAYAEQERRRQLQQQSRARPSADAQTLQRQANAARAQALQRQHLQAQQLNRQQTFLRQQQLQRELESRSRHYRDDIAGDRRDRNHMGRPASYAHANYKRPYRPVYDDRPWYGYHGKGRHPHRRGPVIVYRNVTHIVTIPQPVYVQPVAGYYYDDYYYSGPYAGYDSVYSYDDYGYGYRRSACNSDTVGAVIGAVLGGVIGAHQDRGAGPVVGGALVGAVLGGLLGQAIDDSNRACVGDILEYVPSNQPVYWEDDGHGYQVTPLRTYEPEPGRYCREYQTVVTIGGRAEQAYGTACRQPDGSWQIVG